MPDAAERRGRASGVPGKPDTIVAVATAAGEGAVGIVRMSGPGTRAIAGRVFRARSGIPFAESKPWRLVLGRITGEGEGSDIDEVLAVRMPGPRSFTGEDLVEFHAHGSPYLLESIVRRLLDEGAVPAGPGEFTRRAFLNGRIDLAQAEAVIELIRARGERSRAAALDQLDGGLSRQLSAIEEILVKLAAPLEAAIEFGEEDGIDPDLDHRLLEQGRAHLERLAKLSAKGRAAREGLIIVFSGRTNAGKSSIINRLSDSERSIVTPEAGTTRDTVESAVEVAGFPVIYVDTAGYGRASGAAEAEGMRRSREISQRADLVIPVLDRSRPLDTTDCALLKETSERFPLVLLNKSDLESRLDPEGCDDALRHRPHLAVSALTGEGFGELRNWLAATVRQQWSPGRGEDALLVSARHGRLIGRALDALNRTSTTLSCGGALDLAAADLTIARAAIAEITGKEVSGDLLDEIFGRFCIGK